MTCSELIHFKWCFAKNIAISTCATARVNRHHVVHHMRTRNILSHAVVMLTCTFMGQGVSHPESHLLSSRSQSSRAVLMDLLLTRHTTTLHFPRDSTLLTFPPRVTETPARSTRLTRRFTTVVLWPTPLRIIVLRWRCCSGTWIWRRETKHFSMVLYCEVGNENIQFKPEELETVRELSKVCSRIVLEWFYVARICRSDILLSVNKLTRAVTKWTTACDKLMTRLISYFHSTSNFRKYSHVGKYCSRRQIGTIFPNSDFAFEIGIGCMLWPARNRRPFRTVLPNGRLSLFGLWSAYGRDPILGSAGFNHRSVASLGTVKLAARSRPSSRLPEARPILEEIITYLETSKNAVKPP